MWDRGVSFAGHPRISGTIGAREDRIAVVMNSTEESVFDPQRYPPRRREPGRSPRISARTHIYHEYVRKARALFAEAADLA